MSRMSLVMIAYGLLLAACEAFDLFLHVPFDLRLATWVNGWASGGAMVAAGLAACQGRRSLRHAGLLVGILLPLFLGVLLAWQAFNAPTALGSGLSATLSMISLVILGGVVRARPREGIASRGYAVTTPTTKRPAEQAQAVEEPHRRSEAG
jgi:hypothetical protein